MKNYITFEDIEYDLKKLNLERQIAFEELKGVKSELKDGLTPSNWLQTVLKTVFKMGSFMLVKRVIK